MKTIKNKNNFLDFRLSRGVSSSTYLNLHWRGAFLFMTPYEYYTKYQMCACQNWMGIWFDAIPTGFMLIILN